MEYLTGFAIEKALANLCLHGAPPKYQHRVLFCGILGVIILRAIMIDLGATLISQFSWLLYVFAVFLIATGVKMRRRRTRCLIPGSGHTNDVFYPAIPRAFQCPSKRYVCGVAR